ncbi:hypothetical protein ACIQYQ_01480 [Pseudomonas asiatica]|uniref:nSTAND3 domain-containing NTPase n=1 Tax=Pseudomonas asiatica TaxID=2219225 RepID=UPI00383A6D8C
MSSPKYDLHLLGWHNFQQLCTSVASSVLGQTLTTFLEGNDRGRDGAFTGRWAPQPNELYEGKFVFQCKFTSRRDHNFTLSDVADELIKVRRLVAEGQCDVYVLMTNGDWTGESHRKIESAFENVGVKHVLLLGSTWICDKIQLNSNLRMTVPRLYGLGDLSQIVDDRKYKQTKALLTQLPDLSKMVVTEAYRKSLKALEQHGFVLLVGEPAVGKTTIASLMAICAMDGWGSQVLKLDMPEQIRDHWNTEEQSQFFWIDDAFGAMQYESGLTQEWNRIMPSLSSMIRAGHRVVLTSRDYIYRSARLDLKRSSFPLLEESQVVIDVHGLSTAEREQILYNHIKLGNQTPEFRADLKAFLPGVVSHSRFAPETARRLGNKEFTKRLLLDQISIDRFVEEQEDWLVETMQGLDRHCQAALALIHMNKGSIESPFTLTPGEDRALERLGSDPGGCIRALDSLNGSFVQLVDTPEGRHWRYKHPTIGDAFAIILAQSPEHLQIFVEGTSIQRLMEMVTCGDMGLKNATILPASMFSFIADRLYYNFALELDEESPDEEDLYRFLLQRADKAFLLAYSERDTSFLNNLIEDFQPTSFSSVAYLAIRLENLGLLPVKLHGEIALQISRAVFEHDDLAYICDHRVHQFFEPQALEDFYLEVESFLQTDLRRIRDAHIASYTGDRSPDYYIAGFLEQLDDLSSEFLDCPGVQDEVFIQKKWIQKWIARVSHAQVVRPAVAQPLPMQAMVTFTGWNIFDDVDL